MAPRSPDAYGCRSPSEGRWATVVALVALLTLPGVGEADPFDPKSPVVGATLQVVGPIHGPDAALPSKASSPPPAESEPPAAAAPPPEVASPPPPAAPARPSLLEKLFGLFAPTEAEKSPAGDSSATPEPATPTVAEPPPSLTVSATSEGPPAQDDGAPSGAIAPSAEPTPPALPPPAAAHPEAASTPSAVVSTGPSLLERLFGLFATAEEKKSPTGDSPSETPGPVAAMERLSLPAPVAPGPSTDSAKSEAATENNDGAPAAALTQPLGLTQPAFTDLPLPVIGKIRGPDNPTPEPLPPSPPPSPSPEPSVAAAPAPKPAAKPPSAAPAPTDTAATTVALMTAPPKPKPNLRREPLRDVALALGETAVLGRPLVRGLPAQSCIDRRSWSAVFCVEPVDWPADVAPLFTVNSSLYRGAMAVVRYEPEGAVHYHAIFPTESFAAVVAYLERVYGPPTDRGDRLMAVVGQPRQPNPTARWVSVDATTRQTAVLEVRAFDDVRNFLPDTSFGVIRLFRENARPVFDVLNPSDLLLLRMRQSAVRVDEGSPPAKTGPAKR